MLVYNKGNILEVQTGTYIVFLSPIPSRFNHSIKDWRCRQMWLFVLCQEHSTDINYQCQLHWHPIKKNKVVDRLFQDRISFWVRKRIIH
jgi:hypothetical protein